MRRWAVRACVLSLLACPLVCQGEAAEELARSLAELVQPHVIESSTLPECGGVAALLKAEAPSGAALDRALPSPLDGLAPLPVVPASTLLTRAAPRGPGAPLRGHPAALRRQAALQVFLF